HTHSNRPSSSTFFRLFVRARKRAENIISKGIPRGLPLSVFMCFYHNTATRNKPVFTALKQTI
ncbi:hypothetical protein, partial [Phocaeicola oris]|uniref:hypothetical protein n=1 Tax=Phocaeicola oris TaxID=2896850 RepID=UPI00234F0FEE